MENIVLTIHLIVALCLIGVVLLQRSEGGGLGMGGGGAMTGRAAANALTKLTWILAVGFIITSLSLTVIAAHNSGGDSVLDVLGIDGPVTTDSDSLVPDLGTGILTQPSTTDAPAAPPASE